jgi:hypothetical protein
MTLREIATLRVQQQQLTQHISKTATDLVGAFGAVQGQEYALTKWGLGLRLSNETDETIEQALTKGKILRTHLLRPTWHFVAAKDIRWMLMLTAPRVHAANAYMYRQTELDTALFKKCHRVIEKALTEEAALTRDELNEYLKTEKVNASGHRLSYIMMHAELEGLICSGPRDGNQFTYSLLDKRAPESKQLDKDEALLELTKRYFKSRGPATVNDFATWSGLTVADGKKGIEACGRKLACMSVDNENYYFFDGKMPSRENSGLKLLPIYDELIMGYKKREAFFCEAQASGVKPGFPYDSMILWNSQIVGTWKRNAGNKSAEVKFDFFATPTKQQKAELKTGLEHLTTFFNLQHIVR